MNILLQPLNINEINTLLDNSDINSLDADQLYDLMDYSLQVKRFDIMMKCIEADPDLLSGSFDSITALEYGCCHEVLKAQRYDVVSELLTMGMSRSVLFDCACDLKLTEYLLQTITDDDVCDELITALAMSELHEVIAELVLKGHGINASEAVKHSGGTETARWLFRHGAQPFGFDQRAVNDKYLCQLYLQHGCWEEDQSNWSESWLFEPHIPLEPINCSYDKSIGKSLINAVVRGDKQFVDIMLDLYRPVVVKGQCSYHDLYIAGFECAGTGDVEMLKHLIKNGLNIRMLGLEFINAVLKSQNREMFDFITVFIDSDHWLLFRAINYRHRRAFDYCLERLNDIGFDALRKAHNSGNKYMFNRLLSVVEHIRYEEDGLVLLDPMGWIRPDIVPHILSNYLINDLLVVEVKMLG
jgi:hypothetical protein